MMGSPSSQFLSPISLPLTIQECLHGVQWCADDARPQVLQPLPGQILHLRGSMGGGCSQRRLPPPSARPAAPPAHCCRIPPLPIPPSQWSDQPPHLPAVDVVEEGVDFHAASPGKTLSPPPPAHLPAVDVVEEGVDGEVTPHRILMGGAKPVEFTHVWAQGVMVTSLANRVCMGSTNTASLMCGAIHGAGGP